MRIGEVAFIKQEEYYLFCIRLEREVCLLYKLLLTGFGGAIGALARYMAGLFLPFSGTVLPYTTLLINGIGSFALACLTYSVLKEGRNEKVKLFLGTGVCGGFTTMSTFSLEVSNLIVTNPAFGLIYLVLTFLIGLFMVWLGFIIGSALGGRAS